MSMCRYSKPQRVYSYLITRTSNEFLKCTCTENQPLLSKLYQFDRLYSRVSGWLSRRSATLRWLICVDRRINRIRSHGEKDAQGTSACNQPKISRAASRYGRSSTVSLTVAFEGQRTVLASQGQVT